jgi:hypothetical protein
MGWKRKASVQHAGAPPMCMCSVCMLFFLLIVAFSTRLLQIDSDVFLRCYRQKKLCVLLLIAELLCQLKFAVVR